MSYVALFLIDCVSDIVWVVTFASISVGTVIYHLLRRKRLRGTQVTVMQTFLDIFGSFFAQCVTGIPIRISAQVRGEYKL